jgi:hypothetical protein
MCLCESAQALRGVHKVNPTSVRNVLAF